MLLTHTLIKCKQQTKQMRKMTLLNVNIGAVIDCEGWEKRASYLIPGLHAPINV